MSWLSPHQRSDLISPLTYGGQHGCAKNELFMTHIESRLVTNRTQERRACCFCTQGQEHEQYRHFLTYLSREALARSETRRQQNLPSGLPPMQKAKLAVAKELQDLTWPRLQEVRCPVKVILSFTSPRHTSRCFSVLPFRRQRGHSSSR